MKCAGTNNYHIFQLTTKLKSVNNNWSYTVIRSTKSKKLTELPTSLIISIHVEIAVSWRIELKGIQEGKGKNCSNNKVIQVKGIFFKKSVCFVDHTSEQKFLENLLVYKYYFNYHLSPICLVFVYSLKGDFLNKPLFG